MSKPEIITVLEPEDEYCHEPDEATNYNESMYLNAFDLEQEVGGWFRMGNRVNEGYAEMTVCIYLPGGRVAFLYDRPKITTNTEMKAGGLEIAVIEPFKHLKVTFSGKVCVLDEPGQMADPRTAFKENPWEECEVDLDFHGVSPMYGGKPMYADGTEIETDSSKSFAKAHYEQHVSVTGSIRVGNEELEMNGLGLRDKSWGPRYWQALYWYRWLPMIFGPDFAMMLSVIGRDEHSPLEDARQGGMVLKDGRYVHLKEVKIISDWDDDNYQTAMKAWAKDEEGDEYEIEGEVISLIPLRNRRKTPDGDMMVTRITEAMTRYKCSYQGEQRDGIGMSEYLDQVVDGVPVGPDVVTDA